MGFWDGLKRLFGGKKNIDKDEEQLRLEQNLEDSENLIVNKEEKKVEEKPKEEYKEPDVFKRTSNKAEREQLIRTVKRFSEAPSLAGEVKKLNKGIRSEMEFVPTNNLNELDRIYRGLLNKSAISLSTSDGTVDEALVNVIIENRGKLQHRFSGEIKIITQGSTGRLVIDGILAEQLYEINNFIKVGMTYTSQELKEAMTSALRHFERQYGSIGGRVEPPLEQSSKISSILVKVTFA